MSFHQSIANLFLALAVVLFSACEVPFARQALSCEQIASEALRSLNFDEMNREHMLKWIHLTYQLEDSAIARYDADTLAWEFQGNKYYADFDRGKLMYLTVWWDALAPTADEAINCLGPPDLYRATYLKYTRENRLELELWYPAEGILVQHVSSYPHSQQQPPGVTGQLRMRRVMFFLPADKSAIVARGIGPIAVGNPLDGHPLKQWPGGWEAIEVEVGTALGVSP
jgi:hypothetical protein